MRGAHVEELPQGDGSRFCQPIGVTWGALKTPMSGLCPKAIPPESPVGSPARVLVVTPGDSQEQSVLTAAALDPRYSKLVLQPAAGHHLERVRRALSAPGPNLRVSENLFEQDPGGWASHCGCRPHASSSTGARHGGAPTGLWFYVLCRHRAGSVSRERVSFRPRKYGGIISSTIFSLVFCFLV